MMGEQIYGGQYATIYNNKSLKEIRTLIVHTYQRLVK